MTAQELAARGVTFARKGKTYAIQGPNEPDLIASFRSEVERRLTAFCECRAKRSRLTTDARRARQAYGACDACGDPMGRFVGGWCDVCRVAVSRLAP